jgi:bifunctional ADP-heptose synthase (sugar kinase/adenylyltransferase)/beta-phosphoglucomutase-like phosphatase (HAD superfamily)
MKREDILDAVEKATSVAKDKTVVLVGDFCLDVYYHINSADLEPSLETGLMVRRVNKLKDSLGGAGNVFANLCALGFGNVVPVGVIGKDMFGFEMQRLMQEWLPSSKPLYVQPNDWTTPAYMKPILDGKEQERIDTGLGNTITEETVDILLSEIGKALKSADVVLINQQLEGSIYTDRFIEGINKFIIENPQIPFIVDARTIQHRFHGVWHKLNTHELAGECGIELDPMKSELPIDELKALMERYYKQVGDKMIVSRGEYGATAYDGNLFATAEGIAFMCELDTVGAGDSFFSGFALAMAADLTLEEALNIGNGVSGVTVQKLHQTGTATPEELKTLLEKCDYTYNADAKPYMVTEPFNAEIVTDWSLIEARPAIEYAVFDHDGTISVLREGWEEVMEACMIDAITGGKEVDLKILEDIRVTCRKLITKSTGIQTINQMVLLCDIIKDYGIVPDKEIKTIQEYKAIYNAALMDHIHHRLQLVEEGLLDPKEATVAGSIAFLKALAENGVKVYLASGTDTDDVRHEAELLGYAEFFTGGIFGSVGDVNNDPKRQVLSQIIEKEAVDTRKLAIFGDGPVEMRVAHDNGALAFGVLSNEVRRYGRNESKHARLLHAGADILVPDFLEYRKIVPFLLNKQS